MYRNNRVALLMIALCFCQAQKLSIKHFGNDPILLVKERECKIQIGTIKIVHPINLSSIEEATETLISFSYRNNVETNNPLKNILKYKAKQLYNNLYQLKPRTHHRSKRWDTIGTIWKWIAGTPDAADLQVINSTMNDLIDQNNQQFKVNENIDKRIQHLTNAIKEVMLQANFNKIMVNDIEIITAIMNTDILNKMLEDIQDAIMLSKLSITHNRILSIREILAIRELIQDQGVNLNLPDEALQFVTPKFVTSSKMLLYLMHVPLLENSTTSDIMRIFPLVTNNRILYQYPTHILKTASKLYITEKPDNFVQKAAYLKELNDECLASLIDGKQTTCRYVVQNETSKELINDNTILIRNAKDQTLESTCGPDNRTINGNVLISFTNCTVIFDRENFTNNELENPIDIIERAFHNLKINWKQHKLYELEKINAETISNRKRLDHVYLQQYHLDLKFWKLIGSFSFIGTATVIIIVLLILRTYGTGRSFRREGVVIDRLTEAQHKLAETLASLETATTSSAPS
ncbi:uncharacterized protein LOC129748245 [Uranotaenia lowii]|uniref:uncharacterized protein LOC129748245 n=1 Tax=Uranotaenia lowii TaxID=190385 RepID=UPI002479F60D|nr:uncharacterized protein LOC129748245 [Uranotaenia lowii]